jgi:hypothetical protein
MPLRMGSSIKSVFLVFVELRSLLSVLWQSTKCRTRADFHYNTDAFSIPSRPIAHTHAN